MIRFLSAQHSQAPNLPLLPSAPSYTGGTFSVHLSISILALQTAFLEDSTKLSVAKESAGFAVPRPQGIRGWTELLVQASTYMPTTDVGAQCEAGISCHLGARDLVLRCIA